MTAQEYLEAKKQEKIDKEQAITRLASIDKSIAIMKTRPDLDTPEIRKGILANRQKALELTRPTGKVDTAEFFTKQYDVAQSIPFVPTKDTRELVFKIVPAVVKIKKGEQLSLDEDLALQDWYNEQETNAERGRTIAADAWNIILSMPAFYGEFGIGKKLIGDVAKKGGVKIVESILKSYTQKSFGEFAAKSAGVLASGAAMAATTGAGMSYTSAARNYVNTEDSALKSAYKGFVDAWAENTGEQTGGAMASVFGKITKKVLPQGSKLYKAIATVDNAAIGKKAGKFLEKVGYNGTLEEMGEERFSAMMRAVLGTGEFSEVLPSGKQLATEAIAFAVPGAVGGGLQSIDAARNSVKERTFRLSYEGASDYADKNPQEAAYLAGIQSPSRTDFEKVGLKGYNQQQRQQFADQMRKFEAEKPVSVETEVPVTETMPSTPAVEPQNAPVVEEVQQPVSEQPVPAEQAVEVDTALQEMRQQIIDAGRPVEEADATVELARARAGVISRQTGKPVNDIVTQWNIDIKGTPKAEVTQKVDEIIAPAETTAIPERQINHNAKLPAILTGAKPQYGYRDKQFTLTWSSDIDKAFYITGQKTKSKRDKEYRKFLKDNGFTDAEIDTIGQQVRDNIKATASKRTESGNIVVPNITAQIFKPAVVKKAPVKKPITPKADVPSVPVSDKPAQEVTKSPEPVIRESLTTEKPVEVPADVKAVTEAEVDAVPVSYVNISDIKLSKDVPQFKENADPTSGVVKGERLTGKYKAFPVNPIVLWERLNGDLEVITGRHRLDLARQNKMPRIAATIKRERDGFTVIDALTLDAEANIMDEKGSVKDYAKYFRNTNYTREQAEKEGLLSRTKGRTGFEIGRGATDGTYSAFLRGEISESKAAAIAEAAPMDEDVQSVAVLKAKDMNADELREFVTILKRTKPSDIARKKAKQGNLFGFDDSAIQEAELIAKEISKEIRATKERILSVKGALKRPKQAQEMGLGLDNQDNIKSEVDRLENWLDDLSRVYTTPSLMKMFRERAGLAVATETVTPQEEIPVEVEQGKRLFQSSQSDKRGQIEFTDNGAVITLLENADASTLPHELAHFFLRDMAKSTTEQVKADMAIIRKWLNNKGGNFTTEQEERFARAFEAYLRKGKAPTTALQRVFDNFKAWLSQVYKKATDLKVVLTPEIAGVFDRMLGANSENPNILNQSAVEEPDTEQTSAKNKFTEEQMRKLTTQMFGDNIPNEQTKHYGDVIQNAVDKEYDKNALDIADTVLSKGIILNDEQVVGLSIRALELSNQRHKALLDIAATTDAIEKEMLMTQYNRIEADMAKIYNALNVTGTDTARALSVRRIMIDNANEWTLPTLLAAAEAKKGKPLTEKDVDNTTNWFNKYTEKSKEFDAVVIELRKEKATNIGDVISKVWTRNMDKPKAEQYVADKKSKLAELLKKGCYNG